MSSPTLFLHIGAPKTATTFLQDDVLPQVRSAAWMVKPEIAVGEEQLQFGDLFLRSPDIWKEIGESVFLDSEEETRGRNLIVSDETVYGGVASPQPWIPDWIPASGQRYGATVRLHRQTSGEPTPSMVARHLGELASVAADWGFSETKVLLTLRRQDTKLASSYAQLSNRVWGASQSHFEAWVHHIVRERVGYYMGGGITLDYLHWWKKMTDVLGEDNVFFLPFELLESDPSAFLEQWLGLLEVSEKEQVIRAATTRRRNERSMGKTVWAIRNPMSLGPGWVGEEALRTLGIMSNYSIQWGDFFRDDQIRLTTELKKKTMEVYHERNRVLDEEGDHMSLSEYGYYQ